MSRVTTKAMTFVTQRRMLIALMALLLGGAALYPLRAPAQEITANYAADVRIINAEISRTQAAAAQNSAEEARVAMENTFRLWRIFRQRNIDSRPKDPAFAAGLIKTEEHLFAATQLVDQQQFKAAAAELQRASQVLGKIPVAP